MTQNDTFPRQYARTQRLSLGEPRSFTLSPCSQRLVFARTASGSNTVNMLWVLNTQTGEEKCVFNPQAVLDNTGNITAEELRRRERARESASGVVSYSCDAAVEHAVTIINGQLFLVDLLNGHSSALNIEPGVFDARLNAPGTHVAYIRNGALCVADISQGTDNTHEKVLATDPAPHISWGMADFIAAEEMGRQRGYWWSPNGEHLAACRVDESPIDTWFIADPAHPEKPATEHRYPAAGTANAKVTLHIVHRDSAEAIAVALPHTFEYLNSVSWSAAGLIAQLQTRDQKSIAVFSIDAKNGNAVEIFTDTDDAWVELVSGVPALTAAGKLVTTVDREGARRLQVDGVLVTPTHLQVRAVLHVGETIVFQANHIDSPWTIDVWRCDVATYNLTCLSNSHPAPHSVSGIATDNAFLLRVSHMAAPRAEFSTSTRHSIHSHAEEMLVAPNVAFHTVGGSKIPVAIVTPRDNAATKLPVLFDPYGGPHAQRVVGSLLAYATSQWFADQGFVVVIADGRGTPGKGSAYERNVLHDLAEPVLVDQVEVAQALAQLEPRADTSRVAIRGWSFGGYLAALAVLRRPDIFHCAVAGAPVTDWRLYDTHYTERYLGNPAVDAQPYESTSLMNDAHLLQRPLLLIHGLADDNVVAAHTLQLSSALLAAGKDHEVLPLSGVTHMTPQEVVAENLLLHQLSFIQRSLPTAP